ncbi:hypothetical protein LINGRAHAP2_LOCUS13548 [Linum grandiflorum]
MHLRKLKGRLYRFEAHLSFAFPFQGKIQRNRRSPSVGSSEVEIQEKTVVKAWNGKRQNFNRSFRYN